MPSFFSEESVSPSFLRTTPARKPRTECGCHPAACMIAATVTPPGRLSRDSTVACFDGGRLLGRTMGLRRFALWVVDCGRRLRVAARLVLRMFGLLYDDSAHHRAAPAEPRGGQWRWRG